MIAMLRAWHQFQIDLDRDVTRRHAQRLDEGGDRRLGRDISCFAVEDNNHGLGRIEDRAARIGKIDRLAALGARAKQVRSAECEMRSKRGKSTAADLTHTRHVQLGTL